MINGLTDASSLTSYIFSSNSVSNNNIPKISKLGETDSGEAFDEILKTQSSTETSSADSKQSLSESSGSNDNKSTDPMDLNKDGTVSLKEMLQFIASQQFDFQANQNGNNNSSNFLETLFNRNQFQNAYKQASDIVGNMANKVTTAIDAAI